MVVETFVLERILLDVVEGDLNGLAMLQIVGGNELWKASNRAGPLILTAQAVLRVIELWRQGRVAEDLVRDWAFFMHWGCVGNSAGWPIPSISIEYESDRENVINEALERLEEVGDDADCHFSDTKLMACEARLVSAPS